MQNALTVDGALKTLRIILAALAAGLMATLIVVVVLLRTPHSSQVGDWLGYLALAGLAAGVALRLVIPGFVAKTIRAELAAMPKSAAEKEAAREQKLIGSFVTSRIVCATFCEAPGFLGAVAYMQGGNVVGLIVGAAAVPLVLSLWPSRATLEEWMQRDHHTQ